MLGIEVSNAEYEAITGLKRGEPIPGATNQVGSNRSEVLAFLNMHGGYTPEAPDDVCAQISVATREYVDGIIEQSVGAQLEKPTGEAPRRYNVIHHLGERGIPAPRSPQPLASPTPLSYIRPSRIAASDIDPEIFSLLPRISDPRVSAAILRLALAPTDTITVEALLHVHTANPDATPEQQKAAATNLTGQLQRNFGNTDFLVIGDANGSQFTREIRITDKGRLLGPFVAALLYWESENGLLATADCFPTSAIGNEVAKPTRDRYDLLAQLVAHPDVLVKSRGESGRTNGQHRLLELLESLRYIIAVPKYNVPAESMPEYVLPDGVSIQPKPKNLDEALLGYMAEHLDASGTFNPYELLHGRSLRKYTWGRGEDFFPELFLALDRLRLSGRILETRQSQVKLNSYARTAVGRTCLTRLVSIIEGASEQDPELTLHGAQCTSQLLADTLPIGFTPLPQLIARSASRRVGSSK